MSIAKPSPNIPHNPQNGLRYRQYFREPGNSQSFQVLLLKQLVDSFISTQHRMADKKPRNCSSHPTMQGEDYLPGLSARIARHVNQCMDCMQRKITDNRFFTEPMIMRKAPNSCHSLGATRHATTKEIQMIGILERCHASLYEALKISTGEPKPGGTKLSRFPL